MSATGLDTDAGHRLALGTVQFGLAYGIANATGQVSRDEAERIVALASKSGIGTIDTAIGYGESERCLGQIGMNSFNVVTKLPPVPAGLTDIAAWVDAQIDASLARLGLSQVYAVLLHRSQDLLGANGPALYRALCALRQKAVARKIGVSIYSPSELDDLTENFSFDLVQAPLNIFDRRLANTGWLTRLKNNGVEVHSRSTFLQGLLLLKRKDVPPKFSQWTGILENWHTWLESHNENAVRACVAYPLSLSEVDRVVVGTDNVEHLRSILASITPTPLAPLPDLACNDENLINPARWPHL